MSEHAAAYGDYTQQQLDAQYDTSVPLGGPPDEYFERFRAESAAARAALPFRTLRYGNGQRETVDVVAGESPGAPLFFFVHGGYWRRMSKDDFSFAALPAARCGAAAAIVNYPLAPQASLDEIVAAVIRAYEFVVARAPSLRFDPLRGVAGGHSVGAQLAALVAAAVPLHGLLGLSGLYDLEPIRRSSINATIAMDEACAHRNSPLNRPPQTACQFVVACGEREQAEFHRQQRQYADAWRRWGGIVREVEAPRHDHFSLVLELANARSRLAGVLGELLFR